MSEQSASRGKAKRTRGKRGEGMFYNQKKRDVTVTLTPTAVEHLDALAKQFNCSSRSDLVEQIGRGTLQLSDSRFSTDDAQVELLAKKLMSYLSGSPK